MAAERDGRVSVVAILKGEEPFLDEWIAYHRIIGIDHFFLYDNDSRLPLRSLLARHAAYVTVVDWPGEHDDLPGLNKQTKAYTDALRRVDHEWVAFIDGDEFIVLRKHTDVPGFLADQGDVSAVQLTWHLFGNNGHIANPPGLITGSLTRRRALAGRMTKGIARVSDIAAIRSCHDCELSPAARGLRKGDQAGATRIVAPTDVAHINHYMCRSFEHWMKRIDRGDAVFTQENHPRTKDHLWRFDRELCRRKYLEIEREMNEVEDVYMLKYTPAIEAFLANLAPSAAADTEGAAGGDHGSFRVNL